MVAKLSKKLGEQKLTQLGPTMHQGRVEHILWGMEGGIDHEYYQHTSNMCMDKAMLLG